MRTPFKKSAIALALVAPVVLAACGSNEEEEANATTTATVTSTSAVTTTEVTTSEEPTEEESTSEAAPEPSPEGEPQAAPAPAPAGGAGAPAGEIPQGNPLPTANLEPVAGGQPADPATTEAINGLVGGLYAVNDTRSFLRYVPDHTCSAVLAQNPDVNQIDYNTVPQLPMSQMSPNWEAAGVQSVENLMVDGDQASATVTVNTGETTDTSVMRFRNEGGRWTFCN